MNASPFVANSSLSLDINFLANNYYALSSLTIMFLDEKFGLAGILLTAVIVLYKLVRRMISCHCFSPGHLARRASTSECIPELPDDILMEILVRLPVSSIFHFKSVSRSFRSLVLECHTGNRLPPVLVGVFCPRTSEKQCVWYVSLRKGFGDSSMEYDPVEFLEESCLCYGKMDCKFGLVLCTKPWVSKEIYLCNPATKKCRSIECNVPDDCRFVLAFDPSWSKHHYEVVKISYSRVGNGHIFEVFSSKTSRWDRKFLVTGCEIELAWESCFAGGLLYMFEWYYGLIAINCADGSYKRVSLPRCDPCCDQGQYAGKLCNSSGTLLYSKLCRGYVSVWTLVKNENESCLIRRHVINLRVEVEKMGFSFRWDDLYYYEHTLLFYLDTIVFTIQRATFFYDLESNQLQADTCGVYYGNYILPWSPCLYAVAGL